MTRYEDISCKLRSLVEALPENGHLPAIRTLMEDFQASQATIDHSLSNLVSSGDILRIPGQGYFRSGALKRCSGSAAFCFCYRKECMSNGLYGAMIAALLRHANERSIDLQVFATDENAGIASLRAHFGAALPDCCILLGCSQPLFSYSLHELKIPVIQLYPNVLCESDSTILIDNHSIIAQLLDHLTGLGHRRIAMMHGQNFNDTFMLDQEERMDAFYHEMRQRRLDCSSRTMLYGGFDADSGYHAALQLLDRPPQLRPTAILANDYNAAGIYRAAAQLGLRIPQDLSVTGIDNLPQCQFLAPPLTSVDIEWESSCDTIIQLIRNKDFAPAVHRLPVKLIQRESTQQAAPPLP